MKTCCIVLQRRRPFALSSRDENLLHAVLRRWNSVHCPLEMKTFLHCHLEMSTCYTVLWRKKHVTMFSRDENLLHCPLETKAWHTFLWRLKPVTLSSGDESLTRIPLEIKACYTVLWRRKPDTNVRCIWKPNQATNTLTWAYHVLVTKNLRHLDIMSRIIIIMTLI